MVLPFSPLNRLKKSSLFDGMCSKYSEVACCNSLFHSRLACSCFTGHIQPSVNNPNMDGAANLLNTTSHHFKKVLICMLMSNMHINTLFPYTHVTGANQQYQTMKNLDDTFSRFDMIRDRDGQTYRHIATT